jgi:glutaminyl-peptide cyclotransferase
MTARTPIGMMLVSAIAFAQAAPRREMKRTPEYTFRIVHQYPHDKAAFTQGLVYWNGFFYEGTGLNGQSSLRQVRIETGEVVRRTPLAPEYFGEGITILNDQIYQLTWQAQLGFIYNLADFKWLRSFSYPGEGWGLTTDGHSLFLSDGTPEIRVLDAKTLTEKRRIKVHDGATPVAELNELEFVEGEIYANIWQTERIARISPQTGQVVGWIDLAGLLDPKLRSGPDAVLNGIAYDPQKKRLFVTGKLWPLVFEIKLVSKHWK